MSDENRLNRTAGGRDEGTKGGIIRGEVRWPERRGRKFELRNDVWRKQSLLLGDNQVKRIQRRAAFMLIMLKIPENEFAQVSVWGPAAPPVPAN